MAPEGERDRGKKVWNGGGMQRTDENLTRKRKLLIKKNEGKAS